MCVKRVPRKKAKSSAQNAQRKTRTFWGEKQRNSPEFFRIQDFSSQTEFSVGGDKRDRTADLLNAIQALSQLSYTPEYSDFRSEIRTCVINL